jgi:hypothetical protein
MDWNEELYEAEQKGIATGQKKLIELLESGKSLEEAKRILGI